MEHFYNQITGMFTFPSLYKQMVELAPDNSHFVEIGSWKGTSATFMAVEIINSNKNIKLDCVDPWNLSEGEIITWCKDNNMSVDTYDDDLYKSFISGIEPVKHIITPIRMLSDDAYVLYEDNSIDFLFIDGNHDYIFVKNDLINWAPKMKKNGRIAGHDYCEPSCGVRQAVDEFFSNAFVYPSGIQVSEGCWIVTL